jgi:ABC-2 type transport system permease protein
MTALTFTPAPMPLARVAGAYLAEAKYECVRMMRSPAFAVPFLGIPAVLYSFFGTLAANDPSPTPNAAFYLFTGFGVFGVMGPALFGFGMSMALEREQGVLKLKQAMPMPAGAYLSAKMLMAMVFTAITSLSMIVAAVALDRLQLDAYRFAGIFVNNVAGTLPFCAIGLFIGTRVSGRTAPAIVNVAYLAMTYLSGLFFPLPQSIRFLALGSPAFHLNQLNLAMAGIGSILPQAFHVAALAGITVLFAGLTVRRLTVSASS